MSHHLFGSPTSFRATANRLGIDILGELPLIPGVSEGGDRGVPYALTSSDPAMDGRGGKQWIEVMEGVGAKVWQFFLC